MCREFLGRTVRFEIAITIWKKNDPIGIRDVQKLRVIAGRVKIDPERFTKIALCKSFRDVRLAIAVCIAQHLDLIGATLYNEDVAIRCGKKEPRIAKTGGVQLNFESRRNFGLCVSWPVYNACPIN